MLFVFILRAVESGNKPDFQVWNSVNKVIPLLEQGFITPSKKSFFTMHIYLCTLIDRLLAYNFKVIITFYLLKNATDV